MGASNCAIALIDDSRQNKFAYASRVFPNARVITAPDYHEGTRSIMRGALFCKQACALKQVIEQYRFDILLRMDTDALMIGDSPHHEVLAFLKLQPNIGMVGAFTRRGDGSNKALAMASKGWQLTKEMSLRSGLTNLALMRALRSLVKRAEEHGYSRGDMCTGGAYFLSTSVVLSMLEKGFFDLDVLRHSQLPDDALMALLCCAAGYRLSDMPEDSDVLAINWRGLPMPLEALVSRNKKIVHPIKDDDLAVEPKVRAFFRHRRQPV